MCMPLGPRRAPRRSKKKSETKTKITKEKVEDILYMGWFSCEYKTDDEEDFHPYDGCTSNLYMVVEDDTTTVEVAGRKSPLYKEGYQTIIMDAPFFPATFLLRTEVDHSEEE